MPQLQRNTARSNPRTFLPTNIDQNLYLVYSSTENEHETISNAMEIKARGGGIKANNEAFDYFIKLPDVADLNPIPR